MLSYPEALARVLAHAVAPATEVVPLARAVGRVLAEPLRADRDQPPFDRVAMDGVALDHAAYAAGRRAFPVARAQAAGEAPVALADAATCVEVSTGAVLPPGATTVVRYERLRREGATAYLPDGLTDRGDLHVRGADARRGDELIPPGRRIGIAEVGALASCGAAEVTVRRPPRCAIVGTGSELVAVDAPVLGHQIRASNAAQLHALLTGAGAAPSAHLLPDDPPVLRQRIADLLAGHDLLVVTGGVSRGRRDYLPGVLADCGVERLFHGVAQRPGKPLWAGHTDGALVLALPGNPLAAIACALAYLGPWLRAALGREVVPDGVAALDREVPARPALTQFSPVRIARGGGGAPVATPVRHAGSGDLASLLRTSGLLVLPAGREGAYAAGEVFPYLPLDSLL